MSNNYNAIREIAQPKLKPNDIKTPYTKPIEIRTPGNPYNRYPYRPNNTYKPYVYKKAENTSSLFNYKDPYEINSLADILLTANNKRMKHSTKDLWFGIDKIPYLGTVVADTIDLAHRGIYNPLIRDREPMTYLTNALQNFSESADILANPIKAVVLGGSVEDAMGWGGSGRINYDYDLKPTNNEHINRAANFIAEVLSDPFNWISFGSKSIATAGAKATVANAGAKAAAQELAEAGAKTIAKETAEELAEAGAKTIAKETAEELAESGAKAFAKETAIGSNAYVVEKLSKLAGKAYMYGDYDTMDDAIRAIAATFIDPAAAKSKTFAPILTSKIKNALKNSDDTIKFMDKLANLSVEYETTDILKSSKMLYKASENVERFMIRGSLTSSGLYPSWQILKGSRNIISEAHNNRLIRITKAYTTDPTKANAPLDLFRYDKFQSDFYEEYMKLNKVRALSKEEFISSNVFKHMTERSMEANFYNIRKVISKYGDNTEVLNKEINKILNHNSIDSLSDYFKAIEDINKKANGAYSEQINKIKKLLDEVYTLKQYNKEVADYKEFKDMREVAEVGLPDLDSFITSYTPGGKSYNLLKNKLNPYIRSADLITTEDIVTDKFIISFYQDLTDYIDLLKNLENSIIGVDVQDTLISLQQMQSAFIKTVNPDKIPFNEILRNMDLLDDTLKKLKPLDLSSIDKKLKSVTPPNPIVKDMTAYNSIEKLIDNTKPQEAIVNKFQKLNGVKDYSIEKITKLRKVKASKLSTAKREAIRFFDNGDISSFMDHHLKDIDGTHKGMLYTQELEDAYKNFIEADVDSPQYADAFLDFERELYKVFNTDTINSINENIYKASPSKGVEYLDEVAKRTDISMQDIIDGKHADRLLHQNADLDKYLKDVDTRKFVFEENPEYLKMFKEIDTLDSIIKNERIPAGENISDYISKRNALYDSLQNILYPAKAEVKTETKHLYTVAKSYEEAEMLVENSGKIQNNLMDSFEKLKKALNEASPFDINRVQLEKPIIELEDGEVLRDIKIENLYNFLELNNIKEINQIIEDMLTNKKGTLGSDIINYYADLDITELPEDAYSLINVVGICKNVKSLLMKVHYEQTFVNTVLRSYDLTQEQKLAMLSSIQWFAEYEPDKIMDNFDYYKDTLFEKMQSYMYANNLEEGLSIEKLLDKDDGRLRKIVDESMPDGVPHTGMYDNKSNEVISKELLSEYFQDPNAIYIHYDIETTSANAKQGKPFDISFLQRDSGNLGEAIMIKLNENELPNQTVLDIFFKHDPNAPKNYMGRANALMLKTKDGVQEAEAYKIFIDKLKELATANPNKKIVLVGHNIHGFDTKFLLDRMRKLGMDYNNYMYFKNLESIDTLKLLREKNNYKYLSYSEKFAIEDMFRELVTNQQKIIKSTQNEYTALNNKLSLLKFNEPSKLVVKEGTPRPIEIPDIITRISNRKNKGASSETLAEYVSKQSFRKYYKPRLLSSSSGELSDLFGELGKELNHHSKSLIGKSANSTLTAQTYNMYSNIAYGTKNSITGVLKNIKDTNALFSNLMFNESAIKTPEAVETFIKEVEKYYDDEIAKLSSDFLNNNRQLELIEYDNSIKELSKKYDEIVIEYNERFAKSPAKLKEAMNTLNRSTKYKLDNYAGEIKRINKYYDDEIAKLSTRNIDLEIENLLKLKQKAVSRYTGELNFTKLIDGITDGGLHKYANKKVIEEPIIKEWFVPPKEPLNVQALITQTKIGKRLDSIVKKVKNVDLFIGKESALKQALQELYSRNIQLLLDSKVFSTIIKREPGDTEDILSLLQGQYKNLRIDKNDSLSRFAVLKLLYDSIEERGLLDEVFKVADIPESIRPLLTSDVLYKYDFTEQSFKEFNNFETPVLEFYRIIDEFRANCDLNKLALNLDVSDLFRAKTQVFATTAQPVYDFVKYVTNKVDSLDSIAKAEYMSKVSDCTKKLFIAYTNKFLELPIEDIVNDMVFSGPFKIIQYKNLDPDIVRKFLSNDFAKYNMEVVSKEDKLYLLWYDHPKVTVSVDKSTDEIIYKFLGKKVEITNNIEVDYKSIFKDLGDDEFVEHLIKVKQTINNMSNHRAVNSIGANLDYASYENVYNSLPDDIKLKLPNKFIVLNPDMSKVTRFNDVVIGDYDFTREILPYTSSNIFNILLNSNKKIISDFSTRTQYINYIVNKNFSINKGAIADMSDATIAECMRNNPEFVLVALVEDAKHGCKLVRLKADTAQHITKARALDPQILPYHIYSKAYEVINANVIEQPILKFLTQVMYTFKSGYLMKISTFLNNYIDSTMKNIQVTDSDTLTIVNKQFTAFKLLNTYDEVFKNVIKSDPEHIFTTKSLNEFFRVNPNGYKGMDLEIFKLVDDFMKEGSVGMTKAQIDYYLKRGGDSTIWQTYVKNTSVLMHPNTVVEQVNRFAEYLILLEAGTTKSAAFAKIAKTHFDYAIKSDAERLVELIIPFYTFLMRNFDYWGEMIKERPHIAMQINDFMTPVWDFDSYSYDELSRNKSLQYQIISGNLPLTDNGLTLKSSLSFMDAISIASDPIGSIRGKIFKPLDMVIDAGINMLDKETAQTINDITGGYDYSTNNQLYNLIPVIGPILQRYTEQAPRYYDRTHNILNKILPDVFGATKRWEEYPKKTYNYTKRNYPRGRFPKTSYRRYSKNRASSSSFKRYNNYSKIYFSPYYPGRDYTPKKFRSSSMRGMPRKYNCSWVNSNNYINHSNIYEKLYTKKGTSRLKARMVPVSSRNLQRMIQYYSRYK